MDGFETELKMMELMGKCQRTEVGSRECDECDSREEVEQSGRKEGRKEGSDTATQQFEQKKQLANDEKQN